MILEDKICNICAKKPKKTIEKSKGTFKSYLSWSKRPQHTDYFYGVFKKDLSFENMLKEFGVCNKKHACK